jgi:FPC/CPF motif-containing protein YcgG
VKPNPFESEAAIRNSSLHFAENGKLIAFGETNDSGLFLRDAHREFKQRILSPGFPCLGAKAAFHEQTYGFAAYSELASADATAGLCRDLFNFREHEHKIDNGAGGSRATSTGRPAGRASGSERVNQYATFIAVFRQPMDVDEVRFEELLWGQLRQLHEADIVNWSAQVSSNPADPHFSFSFAGRAFYIVGMHANSSRNARRFPWPTLVFNPHEQFERLRVGGKWKRMQQTIRARELALQGSINPMLNDFGEQSEARQYSGRAVGDDWVAPLPNRAGKCRFAH